MATTTNYGWTTPDDTALVKDGASAIRSLGTAIDTTTKNLNPSTTLGDIEYRSATANTNTRLAIGSSGQCLTVVAGVPSWAASSTSVLSTTGDLLYASSANTLARLGIGSSGNVLTVSGGLPAWAAPATTGDNWVLLNAGGTALTGASTITISSISGRNKLYLLYDAASSASASSAISVRLNGDTASNYYMVGPYFTSQTTYNSSNFAAWSATRTAFVTAAQSNSATGNNYGGVRITGCNASGVKMITSMAGGDSNAGSAQQVYWHNGYWNNSSTVTSISLVSETGNFDNGTLYVYASN